MSKKGGYLIIDLKNKDLITLTDETFSQDELKEMYETIEHNYHKHIIVSGIVINNIEKNDINTQVFYLDDAYHIKVYGLIIDLYQDKRTKRLSISIGDTLTYISGHTDSEGNIKINYSDFPYMHNLHLLVNLGGTIIQVGFSVIEGPTADGNTLLYNDTLHTIILSPTETDYFTITITGDSKANAVYDIVYLG